MQREGDGETIEIFARFLKTYASHTDASKSARHMFNVHVTEIRFIAINSNVHFHRFIFSLIHAARSRSRSLVMRKNTEKTKRQIL